MSRVYFALAYSRDGITARKLCKVENQEMGKMRRYHGTVLT